MIKNAALKEIAEIRFGVHAQPEATGDAMYLQAGLYNNKGKLTAQPASFVSLSDITPEHLLQDGDILLAGKGNRNFAWRYSADMGPAVASSIFFVIRVQRLAVDAGYLTAFFNINRSQQYFSKLGEGSNVASIRKGELGEMNIPIPPIREQQRIAALSQLYQQERNMLEKIMLLKEQLYESILNNLTN